MDIAPALGSLLGRASARPASDSVETSWPIRALRWVTIVLWVVVFAAQFQAVVSGASVQWPLLILTTLLFAGVHLRLWYEESERGRQLHRMIDRMRGRVYEDELTGLPNSRHFLYELRRQMMRALRNGRGFALVLAELRPVERAEAVPDELVKQVARSISQALDPADFVARLHGATFAALAHDDDEMLASQKAEAVGDILVAALPADRLNALQPAVSVTSYGGEGRLLTFLERAQADLARARRLALPVPGVAGVAMRAPSSRGGHAA